MSFLRSQTSASDIKWHKFKTPTTNKSYKHTSWKYVLRFPWEGGGALRCVWNFHIWACLYLCLGKCEWQPCWGGTVTTSPWTVTQSELKAWHRNPAWQEAACRTTLLMPPLMGVTTASSYPPRKQSYSTTTSLRTSDKPFFSDPPQNVCSGWQVHRLPALRLQVHQGN